MCIASSITKYIIYRYDLTFMVLAIQPLIYVYDILALSHEKRPKQINILGSRQHPAEKVALFFFSRSGQMEILLCLKNMHLMVNFINSIGLKKKI